MHIQEFLLARVRDDQASATGDATSDGQAESGAGEFEARRSLIHRHHDRSITVVGNGPFQTVTRCSICIREFTRPCRVLRGLAQPDRNHPDYDHRWDVDEPMA